MASATVENSGGGFDLNMMITALMIVGIPANVAWCIRRREKKILKEYTNEFMEYNGFTSKEQIDAVPRVLASPVEN